MNRMFNLKGIFFLSFITLFSCALFMNVHAEKVRMIVESDLPGGDPDDEGTMTRFFLHLNEFDVEGIIGTRKASQSRTGKDGKAEILLFIDAYEKVYPTLSKHATGYPTPEYLRSITKQCHTGTEGRDLIIKAVDKADSRPLVLSNWGTNEGNTTSARQALDFVKSNRSDAEYKKFAKKIIMCEGGGQPECYQNQAHYPNLLLVLDTFMPDRWYWRWKPITQTAGGFNIDRDILTNHGELAAKYTIQKEGDTPGYIHCLSTGLVKVTRPDFGSWGGRFGFQSGKYQCVLKDTWNGTTNRDNTLARWAVHIQHDFAARADWCVKGFADANHHPKPVINDNTTMDILYLPTRASENVTLSAKGSSDPDSDKLTYQWVYYPEPGTYTKAFSLSSSTGESISVKMPADMLKTDSIHIVLIATDDGAPTLTSYRRIILTGNGTSGSTFVNQKDVRGLNAQLFEGKTGMITSLYDLRGRVTLWNSTSEQKNEKIGNGIMIMHCNDNNFVKKTWLHSAQ